jgi:hypothetical protein
MLHRRLRPVTSAVCGAPSEVRVGTDEGLKPAVSYVRSHCYHTYMAKLTLSVDPDVVERAKRFAERRGTSLSDLVERYLDRLTREAPRASQPPVLARLRGILAGGEPDGHRKHLERKYR